MNYTTHFKQCIITEIIGQNCFQIQSYSTYFSKFSCGGMPPDPPGRSVLRTLLVYPQVIIFFITIAFSDPPQIFCLATPMLELTKSFVLHYLQ